MISLGIDTGGTYTDAVALDLETGQILAKGKSPTTKENLSLGIIAAIDTIPRDLVARTDIVTLSTTLATNACVENKGGRGKLVMLGTTSDILKRIDAEKKFGLGSESVLCIDTNSSFDGTYMDIPDWEQVFAENEAWLHDAEALAVAEPYVFNTGGVVEKSAKAAFEERLGVPFIMAGEISSDVNIMERGATALLNTRLLAVIEEFILAVRRSLDNKDYISRMTIMRSDCSLMTLAMAEKTPVHTILSGPAASALGGMHLSGSRDCLIVDMGGTTTDIAIVKDGVPKLSDNGISIGGWKTQVKGVYVDTIALGGDSALRIEGGKLTLNSRRLLPICFAASRWPEINTELKSLLNSRATYFKGFHEFLCLVREPSDPTRYTEREMELVAALRNGPRMIDRFTAADGIDKYRLNSDRLESEGVIVRSGLTPTDMMHISGDYSIYDKEASELLAKFFLRNLDELWGGSIDDLVQKAYDAVCEKMYFGVLSAMLSDKYPNVFSRGLDSQMELLVKNNWRENAAQDILNIDFSTPYTLVGAGAPIHLFLPRVAKALGAQCVIPEHAEVANAVGAALAEIRVDVQVEISPIVINGVVTGYTVYTPSGGTRFKILDEARAFAQEAAEQEVEREARARGAKGELNIDSGLSSRTVTTKAGQSATFGLHAWALVTGASPA